MTAGGPWRKVLYESQGPDDAHTADAFLEALVVNATVARRSYLQVVRASLPVSQQLSTATLVATASYLLTQGRLTPAQLLCAQLLLLAAGLLLLCICRLSLSRRRHQRWARWQQTSSSKESSNVASTNGSAGTTKPPRPGSATRRALRLGPLLLIDSNGSFPTSKSSGRPWVWTWSAAVGPIPWPALRCAAQTGALFVGGTALLSPLYASLAESISTDTVVFLSTVLLLAHLCLWDYCFAGAVASQSTAASLACAMLATILCASRAGTALAAFAQVTLGLEAYVLFPQLRSVVQAASLAAHAALTLGLVAATVAALLPLSILLATSTLCGAAFVSLICPMWLVRVGKFKAQINGPWDEAVPKLSRDVSLRVASPRKGLAF